MNSAEDATKQREIMNRNVRRGTEVDSRTGTEDDKDLPPHEKLIRYFPEASLALYVALDPLLREVSSGDTEETLLWGALALAAVLGWLYLGRVWKVDTTWQKLVSEVAFVIYVAAIGGPFLSIENYDVLWGAIAAIVFTAFIVFLPAPTKSDADHH